MTILYGNFAEGHVDYDKIDFAGQSVNYEDNFADEGLNCKLLYDDNLKLCRGECTY